MDSYSKLIKLANESINFGSANCIRITSMARDAAEAELATAPESLNPLGFVHGGCLATLADIATGALAHTWGRACVTMNCSLNFLRPATGATIRAKASLVKAGKTVVVCDVTLYDEKDTALATGTFTYYVLEPYGPDDN